MAEGTTAGIESTIVVEAELNVVPDTIIATDAADAPLERRKKRSVRERREDEKKVAGFIDPSPIKIDRMRNSAGSRDTFHRNSDPGYRSCMVNTGAF